MSFNNQVEKSAPDETLNSITISVTRAQLSAMLAGIKLLCDLDAYPRDILDVLTNDGTVIPLNGDGLGAFRDKLFDLAHYRRIKEDR